MTAERNGLDATTGLICNSLEVTLEAARINNSPAIQVIQTIRNNFRLITDRFANAEITADQMHQLNTKLYDYIQKTHFEPQRYFQSDTK